MLGVPMMFPAVVPCELGPVIPVGMLPATTAHCTGVGVAPLLNVVLHPVVSKLTAVAVPAVRVTSDGGGRMVQPPVGGAGVVGTGVTEGVQPVRVIVAVGVRPPSEIVTWQSGAVKLSPWIRYCPVGSARTSATLVVDAAVMNTPGELLPSRRS